MKCLKCKIGNIKEVIVKRRVFEDRVYGRQMIGTKKVRKEKLKFCEYCGAEYD